MPHLVIIDKDGKIVTKEGVNALTQDPTGKQFPWRPNRIVDMLPNSYRSGDLSTDEEIVLLPMNELDEKYILLYFASHLDALSQEFTPWLVKAYNILKNKRDDFEVSTDFLFFGNIVSILGKMQPSRHDAFHPDQLLSSYLSVEMHRKKATIPS